MFYKVEKNKKPRKHQNSLKFFIYFQLDPWLIWYDSMILRYTYFKNFSPNKILYHLGNQRKCFEKESVIKEFFKIFFVLGPNAQIFARRFLTFPCPMEIILRLLMIVHFSTNFSRFSPKISRIFIPFPIVLLHLSHFWAFLINVSTRY